MLTAGGITLVDGITTITAMAGTWTILPGDDALLCGSCAVTRWLRVLDLVVTRPSNPDIAQALEGESGDQRVTAPVPVHPHL